PPALSPTLSLHAALPLWLLADPLTRYRVTDPLRFYTTVFDEIGAKARLDDIVNSELRREIASHNFGEIVGHAREPLMQNVAERRSEEHTSELQSRENIVC